MITVIMRWLLGILFVLAGANHFWHPDFYLAIMPPWLPWHVALVQISGVAEILGGIGILVPTTRRFAGWGLIALLIAVFPANIYMATAHVQPPGLHVTPFGAWMRLPFQALFLAWVWWVALRRDQPARASG
jgi:uncharacterized membrane protein